MVVETIEPTLQNILDHKSLKWIFVGGKGGVDGVKTSLGSTISEAGERVDLMKTSCRDNVLIISTDPAHNLSDAFRQKFTRKPTQVEGFTNLDAMEVDPSPEEGELEGFDDDSGGLLSDLAGSIPGIDEAMSFAEVMRQVQSMSYSVIIFDTAPTGHTLRLLQFPSTLEKGLAKLASLRGMFGGLLDQVASMIGASMGGNREGLLGKLEDLKGVVEEVNKQFKDAELTTFICVCIPEFLSLYETERLVQELAKFEIETNNIIINQVIFPEEAEASRLLKARIKMQQKYLDQYDDLYEDFHLIKIPLMEEEVRGIPALTSFSQKLIYPHRPVKLMSNQLEEEIETLRARCKLLEQQLGSLQLKTE